MPARPEGVYADGKGGWYFKATLGRDPLTGKRSQVTKRGFRTAAEAAHARKELLGGDRRVPRPSAVGMTLNELLDLYLDGLDADERLSVKTRFDYRKNAESYVRPLLGTRRLRDITPETILEWQPPAGQGRRCQEGQATGAQHDPPGSRAAGRRGQAGGLDGAPGGEPAGVDAATDPEACGAPALEPGRGAGLPRLHGGRSHVPDLGLPAERGAAHRRAGGAPLAERRPRRPCRQGRRVLVDDRLRGGRVAGKSPDAIRTIDLDDQLVAILREQRKRQAEERLAGSDYIDGDHVFTRLSGGPYHPQSLSRQLADLSVLAGLPRLTAHGLRHTSATLMLASGVPPKVAAERLGHADATLFTNLYSHVTPTMQREAADRLGAALFGSGGGAPEVQRRPRRSPR